MCDTLYVGDYRYFAVLIMGKGVKMYAVSIFEEQFSKH